jgi:hypothetical protein
VAATRTQIQAIDGDGHVLKRGAAERFYGFTA